MSVTSVVAELRTPGNWDVAERTPPQSAYPAAGSEDLAFVKGRGRGVRADDVIILTRIG